MKTYMLVWIFFSTSVVVLHRFTKAECEDTDGEHCEKRKCGQPGYAQYCRKTCGMCEKECPGGQYPLANGTCVSCHAILLNVTSMDNYKAFCGNICPRGRWGPSCTKNCSKGCVDNTCIPKNGVCRKGCKSCNEGSRMCQTVKSRCICNNSDSCACHVGYSGNDCAEICSTKCKSKQCNDNGDCTRGCNAGKYGPKCNKQCPNCVNDKCSFDTGNCINGCKAGFYGVKCSENCSSNGKCQRDRRYENCQLARFGDTCDKGCPVNCASHFCNQTDGSCSSCKSGFHGDHCNVTCPDKCADAACDQHGGSCQGCNDSYRGSHCMLSCPDHCIVCDQYEDRCSSCSHGWCGNICHNECDTCLGNKCNSTCTCLNGCKTGWFGDKCEQKCNLGCKNSSCVRNTGICIDGCTDTVYGAFCNNSCSDHCYQERCHTTDNSKVNTICTVSCKNGWSGDYCDIRCPQHCFRCDRYNGSCLECEGNRYEVDCSKTCSKNCIYSTCNVTGFCTGGCQDGRYGKTCSDSCNFRCRRCGQLTGQCLSCVHGWTGAQCMESILPSLKKHIWILTVLLCVFILLMIILLIRRKYLSSCISRSHRGIYISPVPNNESGLPLQEGYPSGGHSDHPYASIDDEDEFSGGSNLGSYSDRFYEPVGRPQPIHYEN